jgi:hypothetical protein
MLKLQEIENILADLTTEKLEIEAMLARDWKQELLKLEGVIEHYQAKKALFNLPGPPSNGHAVQRDIYAGAKSIADKSIACLKAVNGAWLSPTEIGEKLLEAGVITNPRHLSTHVTTALKRRMESPSSPDRELEFDRGRFRYRQAKPTILERPNEPLVN